MHITIEISKATTKRLLLLGGALVVCLTAGIAYSALSVPTFNTGDTLNATSLTQLSQNITNLDTRLAAVEAKASSVPGLVKPTPFFGWARFMASVSGVETYPVEGTQTITFSQAGYYRVTLNAQAIHDTNDTGAVSWYIGGTATRLDPYSQEVGAKIYIPMDIGTSNSRLVETTVLFVSATAGQTLTLRPSLTVTYSSGMYHEAQFMYGAEYLGS